MALEAKLLQKLSQNLLMTPQLQQAIKLLQLGRLEYLEAIEKELLDNPLLEELKEEGEASNGSQGEVVEASESTPPSDSNSSSTDAPPADSGDESRMDWEGYLESFTDSSGSATPKGTVDFEDRPQMEPGTKAETLFEHLVSQLRMSDLCESDERLALQLIGNLDKNGYLVEPLEEISKASGCSVNELDRVLRIVRDLDPPGVGARDLKECLIIQLENMGLGNALEARIIQNHLDKLEKHRYDLIAKSEHCEVEDVHRAVTSIRRLEPRPGRPFADDSTRYVTPDVYVYKVGSEFVISLNEDGLPKLRVSPYYLKLLKSEDAADAPTRPISMSA